MHPSLFPPSRSNLHKSRTHTYARTRTQALDEQALQKIETEDAPGAGGAGGGGEEGGGEDLGPDVPDEDLDVE